MKHWLVKSEPDEFSWEDHVREGVTVWTGVRNFAARNNLRTMAIGDPVLFYHSGKYKGIVGLSKVVRSAYPDPTAQEGDWSVVDLSPTEALPVPLSLERIKNTQKLQNMALLRLSRLSVQPVSQEEYDLIVEMAHDKTHGSR